MSIKAEACWPSCRTGLFIGITKTPSPKASGSPTQAATSIAQLSRTPRVLLDTADDISVKIGCPLALGDWIFMHPVNASLLHRQKAPALIDIAAHPAAAAI